MLHIGPLLNASHVMNFLQLEVDHQPRSDVIAQPSSATLLQGLLLHASISLLYAAIVRHKLAPSFSLVSSSQI
jgi:hypothetical protein